MGVFRIGVRFSLTLLQGRAHIAAGFFCMTARKAVKRNLMAFEYRVWARHKSIDFVELLRFARVGLRHPLVAPCNPVRKLVFCLHSVRVRSV